MPSENHSKPNDQDAHESGLITRLLGWLIAVLTFFAIATPQLKGSERAAGRPQAKLTRESDLKAAFLFNFSQFVAWPEQAFSEGTAPFVIGVLGDDPFGKSLDEIVANELAHGHKIVVRRYRNVRETKDCHILYVSPSETPRLQSIFEFLAGKHILAVGDAEGFATGGGAVRFVVQENKLRLRINMEAARAAQLTISSKLLRQAEILESKPGKQ